MKKKDEKDKDVKQENEPKDEGYVKTEKEELLELHQKLLDLGIHSIGDLEVMISRL